MLPDHLTYEPTEYPYPFQYELQWNPDAKRIYYTEAYWNHMQATAERRERLTEDVAAAVLDQHLNTSVAIRVSTKGTDTTPTWQQEKRTCAAPQCQRKFTPKTPSQACCGAVKCQKEHRAARQSQYNATYEAKQKRTAKRHTRTCPVCDATFTTTYRNKTQRTCGNNACTSEARSRAGKRAHELKGAAA